MSILLYDADSTLSADTQSTRDAEAVLAQSRAKLLQAAPQAKLSHKQRLMHFLQDKRFRLPHLSVRFGVQLLKGAGSRLGNAVWDLYERVFISALDAHDYGVSSWCLSTLDARWPDSVRVQRLKAMNEEARGHFSSADDILQDMLEQDPSHIGAMKRQIACAKAAGDLGLALSLLNRYVKVFSADEHAWLELVELYCQSQQYELACFACEELILLAPENYLYHLRLAEAAYTCGNMDTARQYYAQSLELKPNNNMRALYGLILTLKSKGGASGANAAELSKWSADQLLAHYKKFAPHLLDIAKQTALGEAAPAVIAAAPVAAVAAPAAAAAVAAPAAVKQAAPVASPAKLAKDAASEDSRPEPQESELPD